MQDGRDDRHRLRLRLLVDAHVAHRVAHDGVLLCVVAPTRVRVHPRLLQDRVLGRRSKLERTSLRWRRSGDEHVQRVVGPLIARVVDDAVLLEEVCVDRCAYHQTLLVQRDLDKLAETRRVVVTASLGVPERFEDWIRLEDRLGEVACAAAEAGGAAAGAPRKVTHQILVRLRLASTRLTADDDALRLAVAANLAVRLFGDGEDVREGVGDGLADEVFHRRALIDGQRLVRVDRKQDGTGERVDVMVQVTAANVGKKGAFGELDELAVVGHGRSALERHRPAQIYHTRRRRPLHGPRVQIEGRTHGPGRGPK